MMGSGLLVLGCMISDLKINEMTFETLKVQASRSIMQAFTSLLFLILTFNSVHHLSHTALP